jgi:ABC-type amino acid transport system permease subunit
VLHGVVNPRRIDGKDGVAAAASLSVWLFRGTPVLVQVLFWNFLSALHIGQHYLEPYFARGTPCPLPPSHQTTYGIERPAISSTTARRTWTAATTRATISGVVSR